MDPFYVECGVLATSGRRPYMEDRHAQIVTRKGFGGDEFGVFAVFDGHGGTFAAEHCEENFLDMLLGHQKLLTDTHAACHETVKQLDDKILDLSQQLKTYAGATLNAVVVSQKAVVCCNVGDSRAVLCRDGEAVSLSVDHTPLRQSEIKRIHKAGGFVSSNGLNGVINVTRAVGDLDMKGHKELTFPSMSFCADLVVSEPEMISHDLQATDEFIIVATDGLWCKVSNEIAVKSAKKWLRTHGDTDKCAKKLAKMALDAGSTDNITVMVISLKEWSTGQEKSRSLHQGLLYTGEKVSVHGARVAMKVLRGGNWSKKPNEFSVHSEPTMDADGSESLPSSPSAPMPREGDSSSVPRGEGSARSPLGGSFRGNSPPLNFSKMRQSRTPTEVAGEKTSEREVALYDKNAFSGLRGKGAVTMQQSSLESSCEVQSSMAGISVAQSSFESVTRIELTSTGQDAETEYSSKFRSQQSNAFRSNSPASLPTETSTNDSADNSSRTFSRSRSSANNNGQGSTSMMRRLTSFGVFSGTGKSATAESGADSGAQGRSPDVYGHANSTMWSHAGMRSERSAQNLQHQSNQQQSTRSPDAPVSESPVQNMEQEPNQQEPSRQLPTDTKKSRPNVLQRLFRNKKTITPIPPSTTKAP